MIAYRRIRFCTAVLLSLLVLRSAGGSNRSATLQLIAPQAGAFLGAQQLTAEGTASLKALIDSGNLPDLHWPDFSAYRNDVAKFYESYGYSLPWVTEMGPSLQAQAVIGVLQRADEKGLSAEDYDGPEWAGRLAKLRPFTQQPAESEAVRFDLALTISLMRYISDLHTGRIDPRRFGIRANIERRKYNLPEFLAGNIVNSPDASAAISQVEPPYPGYQRTLRALQTYRRLAREQTGQPLPDAHRTIVPNEEYSGVPRLAQFLRLVGDLPRQVPIQSHGTIYRGALVKAVKMFQSRHGLTPDGRIDAHTLEELNVPLDRRVQQIQLTLERWRWLPSAYAEFPIVVNIPEFRLRAYDANFRIAVTMKVVVGEAYNHDTPIFASNLRSIIFRPHWDVPLSIAESEIVPAIESNPRYLKEQNMEILDGRENVVTADVVNPEMLDQVLSGKLFVRQRPGRNNSLGLIKFEFPNAYDIYMHGTPATVLFSRSRRDFSHGCIRLENPAELAAWALRDNPGWDINHIRAAMNGDETQSVELSHPIPILIVYGTVVILQDGIVHFYDDLYGQDAELEQALMEPHP